jgi:hypothetical protein
MNEMRRKRTAKRAVVSMTAAASLAATATLALTPTQAEAAEGPTAGRCETGRFCLWEKPDFKGARHTYELSGVGIDSCVPLPKKTTAEALANRMGRPVTTYQSEECAETGEFQTYPGDGTWAPRSPYQVRAFKVWDH